MIMRDLSYITKLLRVKLMVSLKKNHLPVNFTVKMNSKGKET